MKIPGFCIALFSLIAIPGKGICQEVIKKKKYTLTFESNYADFDPSLKKKLIETFFKVYPKLAKEYNKNTNREVKFMIDTAYKGVAATGGGRVVFSAAYMQKHKEDIDVVTHEVMHIVQNYGRSGGPGWLTEGIADYARYKFGVNNEGAKWALPPYKAGQSYRNSYRITAAFFNWLETKQYAGLVKKVDAQLRDHTYTSSTWKDLTGKTLDELWADYASAKSVTS
jgi:hypothetical protein